MKSPFPGVDPYLESQHYWRDFHATFVPCWRRAISAALPPHYEARIEEQVQILELDPDQRRRIVPDVAVFQAKPGAPPLRQTEAAGNLAILEPVTVPFPVTEEVRDRWIEILNRTDRSLVAVLELLSPSNKIGPGRGQYLAKRSRLFLEEVHLVEIDLLVGGQRLPMGKTLPPGDFYAFVGRSDRRPDAEVYAWTVRDRLPVIPIPLLKPDKDATVDLEAVFAQAYEFGEYAHSVDYGLELNLGLDETSTRWAEDLAKRTKR